MEYLGKGAFDIDSYLNMENSTRTPFICTILNSIMSHLTFRILGRVQDWVRHYNGLLDERNVSASLAALWLMGINKSFFMKGLTHRS